MNESNSVKLGLDMPGFGLEVNFRLKQLMLEFSVRLLTYIITIYESINTLLL